MTSANVSNMTMQVAVSQNLVNKADSQSDGSDFMQVMSESMQGGKQKEPRVATSDKAVEKGDAPVKVESKPNEIKSAKQPVAEEETAAKISEETADFAEEVKEVISEELGVSEEEIVDAMETLGLTFLDLTDKTNLAQLVSKLTNCNDNVALLVNESFANIVSDIGDLTEELMVNTGCSMEQLQTIMNVNAEVLEENVTFSDAVDRVSNQVTEGEDAQDYVQVNTPEMAEQEDVVSLESEDVPVIVESEETKQTETSETEDEVVVQPKTIEQVTKDVQEDSYQGQQSFSENNQSQREHSVALHHQEHTIGMNQQVMISQYEPMTGEITLQTGEVVDVREIIDQIVEAARTTISSENTTLEMLLNPEGLGKILMEVTQRDGKVTAHIYTQDENVKQALEHQMIQLKEQMNQGGTKVNSIEVSVGTHEFERNLEEGQHHTQQGEAEQQRENHRTRNINLNSLDELSGLMTEEEELVTKIMRENGNSVNYTA